MKRIKKFLMYDEIDMEQLCIENNFGIHEKEKNVKDVRKIVPGIYLKSVSAKWSKTAPDNSLENINLEINSTDHLAVVGSVGSGKTTLLQVILKELIPIEGTVNLQGTVSYASQEPWLFGASVRQNILFGQEYKEEKYKEIVRVCALDKDFSELTHGDQTLVGERGVTLSGGQKARVNLARAVYREADIYLLDDPLSAVDAQVGKQLFEDCICDYLKNKCVILVTHQLQYLKNVDKIILLKDGQIHVSGSYEDLKNSDSEFTNLLVNIEKEEADGKHKVNDKDVKEERDNDVQKLSKEEKSSGDVSWYVYKSYMLAGGHWCKVGFLATFFVITQVLTSLTDYFVTFW